MFTAPRHKWIAIKCKHPEDGSLSVVICAYDQKFDVWLTPDYGWLDHEDCSAWSDCSPKLVAHLIATEKTLMTASLAGDKGTRDRAFKTQSEYINSPQRSNTCASIY
jgi:hypothetical protein